MLVSVSSFTSRYRFVLLLSICHVMGRNCDQIILHKSPSLPLRAESFRERLLGSFPLALEKRVFVLVFLLLFFETISPVCDTHDGSIQL